MKIIRVFPRRTSMTPSDADVRINTTPDLFDEADEVHISCLFSWDRQCAEQLADAWVKAGFNVKLGGVAFSSPSEEFVVGRYVKKGAVITSRGCPNRCWFSKDYYSRFIAGDDYGNWNSWNHARPVANRTEPTIEECGQLVTYTWEEK